MAAGGIRRSAIPGIRKGWVERKAARISDRFSQNDGQQNNNGDIS
jgi:hypothetical protein